ncbi:phage protein Gp27 family protein [Brevibacillus thermoruber]|uniref:phage protein Gp27 family protein n=1 Tax=Brevibacillus thermoruber TaxID=33942 RepID=UPI0005543A67|nr:phage protein Gp27 family protein [Brevibacillus thermoruber]
MADARNRSHSKVTKLPTELQKAINDAIVNGRLTYKQIHEMVVSAGHNISEASLQRYGKKFLAKLEAISIARDQAKAIIESCNGPNTDMAEATSTVAFQILMEMLVNSPKKPGKATLDAIKALATLERSTIAREKLKFTAEKAVKEAAERIKAELRETITNDPELLEKLIAIVESNANVPA